MYSKTRRRRDQNTSQVDNRHGRDTIRTNGTIAPSYSMIFPPRGCHVTAYRPHLQSDTASDADFLQLQEAALFFNSRAKDYILQTLLHLFDSTFESDMRKEK